MINFIFVVLSLILSVGFGLAIVETVVFLFKFWECFFK